MKNFVFGSLAMLLASGATGCIISSDDSGSFCGDGFVDSGESCDDGAANGTSGSSCTSTCTLAATTHTTHATWKLQNIDGTNSGCPAGFDTAVVVSWKISNGSLVGTCAPGGTPTDSCYLDVFSCDAGQGTTGPIRNGGTFLTYVVITNHAVDTTYATSLSDVLDLTTSDQSFPADSDHLHGTMYKNGGYFTAAWSLKGTTSGSTLTCSQAGSGGVSILSTVTNGSQAADDVFNCTDGDPPNPYLWTGGLLEGSYTVSVTALDTSNPGKALGAPTNLTAEIIDGQNRITDLGDLVLNVDD